MSEIKENSPIIIKRNATKQIQVTAHTFKGKHMVSVRQFIDTAGTGDLWPTKLGMTFYAEDIDAIIEAIQEKKKLLPDYK